MRMAYLDCFSGVAGDMFLAALLDAGWAEDELRALPARLNLPGVSIATQRVKRHGIAAQHVRVDVAPEARKKHRHLPQIEAIIAAADLPATVQARAAAVFRRLAEAEAAVHGTTLEKVHFHEVGANDAIIDIVGAAAGLHALGIDTLHGSPIPTGHGTVQCEHGEMPIPAPATARLLCGVPLAACAERGELTTPTGAALAVTLATSFGPPPAMRLERVGVGAGTRDSATRANILRLLIGSQVDQVVAAVADTLSLSGDAAAHLEAATELDAVHVLEAQIDDGSGQSLAFAVERLLAAGALDAFLTPVQMKKGRPGHLLTVLTDAAGAPRAIEIILNETPTLGVRRALAQRHKLVRRIVTVETDYGAVRLKLAQLTNGGMRAWPEYEDCAAAALRHSVPLRLVHEAALARWQALHAAPAKP